MDHNPNLTPWQSVRTVAEAGKGTIEKPSDSQNIVWQTRSAPPSDYETQLCQTLESLFQTGVSELDAIVEGLNQAGFKTPAGTSWTEQSFQAEMKRLGA